MTWLRGLALLFALLSPQGLRLSDLRAEDRLNSAMTVSVVKARTGCVVDRLQLSGTIVAREEVFVRPETEGLQLGHILVESGANVSAGHPIAQLIRPEWMPGSPPKSSLLANATGVLIHPQLPIGLPTSLRGDPLFRIIKDGELELLIEVPQIVLPKIKPGQSVSILPIGSAEGHAVPGIIRLINPEVESLTQLAHARVQLRGPTTARLGTYATASIEAGQSCGVLVPLTVVLYDSQGPIVDVVRDNHIETRHVQLGLFETENVEILSGVAAGEPLIAKAGAFLREGEPVNIAP